MARWWNLADTRASETRAHHAALRVQVPPWSLLQKRRCLWCNWQACDPVKVEAAGSTPPEHPVLRLQAPALRRLVGQFDSGMGYYGSSRGSRVLGLRSPVGRFDSCTTYCWP